MATDKKTTKAKPDPAPAPKSEAAPAKDKSASGEAAPKTEASKTEASKTESSDAVAAAPSSYSRGEGQKPVSAAYRENWNAIFAKKSAKRRKR